MRKLFLCMIFLFLFLLPLYAVPAFDLLNDDTDQTVFELNLDYPYIRNIGEGYSMIVMPEYGPRGDEYGPLLYGYTFKVAVSGNADVSVSLESVVWTRWFDILPSSRCSLTINHAIPGPADMQFYNRAFGGSAVLILDQIWRGVRVIGVDIIPVQYDPELGVRFMKKARIIVSHQGGDGNIYNERLYHPAFAGFYRASLVNPESAIPKTLPAPKEWDPDDGAELLVIVRTDFEDELQPWIDWKLLQGFPIKVFTTSETGSDTTSIKNFVQNAYDTWTMPPAFLLLASDADYINCFQGGGVYGDQNYGTVVGGDNFPDIYIGRMSADNSSQMDLLVRKHLDYEKEPDMADDYWARAVGLANEDEPLLEPLGPGDSSYYEAVRYGMEQCQLAGFTDVQLFRRLNGDDYNDVRPYIQAGCGFVQYRGQAWPDYYYDFSGGLDTLDNDGKCPINISITCGTGGFMYADNRMCERSTRAGTTSDPKGSVAFIGQAIVSSNSVERSSLSKHIFEGFFEQDMNQLGVAHLYGKNEMYSEFGGSYDAQTEYLSAVLIGSPEMLAWTAPIQYPSIDHPSAVNEGPTSIEVTVTASTVPVENARIAIHRGVDFSYGLTNASGFASINIEADPSFPLIIVVTGPNIYPYIDTIDVLIGGVGIYSAPVSFSDIGGDHDGLLNPGELITFNPKVTNLGDESASGLTGIVRINDPMIVFSDSTCSFAPVAPGDTVIGDAVAFSIHEGHEATANLELTIVISGHPDGPWERAIIPLPDIHRFEAKVGTIQIFDPIPFGNGDGQINPGEQIALSITLDNETQADAFNVGGRLNGIDSVAVVQVFGDYEHILRSTSSVPSPEFMISVSPEALSGTEFALELAIWGECPMYVFDDTLEIGLSIAGSPGDQHTGPDAYGYYIYDDTDMGTGRAPTYEWNDITGPGTQIWAITNSDDGITDVSLPFTAQFYGDEWTEIAVSSNGFAAPPGCSHSGGGSGSPQEMPNTGSPAGVIALVWADLAPHRSGADIFQYNDAANNQFVIQWDQCGFYWGGGEITAQMRICNPDYYTTPTDDSEIYFYYNYYETSGNLGVGIESPDESNGLQYFRNGDYDENAATLEAGRALRITTLPPDYASSPWIFFYDSLRFDDSPGNNNGTIEPGDEIDMYFRLKNGGSAGAWSTNATPLATTLITPTCGSVSYGTIFPGVISSSSGVPLSFSISAACPPDTIIIVPVEISASLGAYIDTIGFMLTVGLTVDIKEYSPVPKEMKLCKAYPNPFNSSIAIPVNAGNITNKAKIDLSIYSLKGRKITTIFNGIMREERHVFHFDAEDLKSGIYFVRLTTGEQTYTRKILLIR